MEIDQELLQRFLDQGQAPVLIDVREDYELSRGVLPGAIHIPMSQLQGRSDEIPSTGFCVVYCEHGVRSLHVVAWLVSKGIDAKSLAGGFADWRGPIEGHQ